MRPASASHSSAPVPAASAAGIAISARSIWWATNPNGSEGIRSIARWRSRYEPRSGASAIRMATSTQEDRADGQVGPGEELVLEGRQRPGALEQPFGGDQPDQHGDQDQHRVLEHRRRRGGRAGPPSGSPAASPATRSARGRPGGRRGAPGGAGPRRPRDPGRACRGRRSPAGSADLDGDQGIGGRPASAPSTAPGVAVGPDGEAAAGRRLGGRGDLLGRLGGPGRQDSPRRSRSSRASSSRRTARCGGMCSRKAVISPISSNAACDGVGAGLAAVARRQGGRPLVGRVGQLVAADGRGPRAIRRAPTRRPGGSARRPDRRRASGPARRRAPGAARAGTGGPRGHPGRRPASARPARGGRGGPAASPASTRTAARSESSSSSGCRPSGLPSTPRSRSSSASSQTLGAGGGSPSSRAITAPSHSTSARSASIAMAWCNGSNSRMVSTFCAATRASASHCLARAATSRCRAVPAGAGRGQVVERPALQLGQPARDGPPGLLGRFVGFQAVELAPDLHPGRDGIEPGHRRVPAVGAPSRARRRPRPPRRRARSPRRTTMPPSPSRRPRITSPVVAGLFASDSSGRSGQGSSNPEASSSRVPRSDDRD